VCAIKLVHVHLCLVSLCLNLYEFLYHYKLSLRIFSVPPQALLLLLRALREASLQVLAVSLHSR